MAGRRVTRRIAIELGLVALAAIALASVLWLQALTRPVHLTERLECYPTGCYHCREDGCFGIFAPVDLIYYTPRPSP